MKLKRLPLELSREGFRFRQVKRVGDLAIYEQTKGGALYTFEVVRVTTSKPNPRSKEGFDLVEVYPIAPYWGVLGWSFMTLAGAEAKFEALEVEIGASRSCAG